MNDAPSRQFWLPSFWLFLKDYWPNLLSIVGSIGLTVSGILPRIESGEWKWTSPTSYAVIFIFSLFLSIVGGISLARRTKGSASLKEKLKTTIEDYNKIDQSQKKIVSFELSVMYQILEFGDTERISLYKHNGKALVMIGRFAMNPLYGKPGRGFLKETEGVVGAAWQNGKAFVDDLPEVNGNNVYAYLERCCLDWNMEENAVKALIMKSRTLGAYAISNSYNTRMAVAVFESTKPSGFTVQNLQALLNNSQMRRLSLLLEEIQATTPNPSDALQKGF